MLNLELTLKEIEKNELEKRRTVLQNILLFINRDLEMGGLLQGPVYTQFRERETDFY